MRLPCHITQKATSKAKAKSAPKSDVVAVGEAGRETKRNYHRISHGRFAPKMVKGMSKTCAPL